MIACLGLLALLLLYFEQFELTESGIQSRNGSLLDFNDPGRVFAIRDFFDVLKKGSTKPPLRGSLIFILQSSNSL